MSYNMSKNIQNKCVDCNSLFTSNKEFNRCFGCRKSWYNNHIKKCSGCNEIYRTFLDNGKRTYRCFRCSDYAFNKCRICNNKTHIKNEMCSICYKDGIDRTLSLLNLEYI